MKSPPATTVTRDPANLALRSWSKVVLGASMGMAGSIGWFRKPSDFTLDLRAEPVVLDQQQLSPLDRG